MSKLVIVESPAKVKTIRKFLPRDFKVDSCVGHIRDLPKNRKTAPKAIQDEDWADLAVNVDDDFQPYYVTIRGKGKVIKKLKAMLKDADELYLATDEDREGESISWHLVEALNPSVPVKRMVFNEITQEAIEEALANPRDLDMDLVQAQETRRILDRLFGYRLSDLLRKKIGGNLSAGRVQTPAVRLVVNRERERRAFRSASYWDVQAILSKTAIDFEANLLELGGDRIATSADFDRDTGELYEESDAVVLTEEQAADLVDRVESATWTVADVEQRQRQSSPDPPFITSTLQQAANGRLNLSPGQTMRIAQDLYEDGYITYMRTDSTTLSKEALEGAKKAILDAWGPDWYKKRTYETDKSEGAQEAHEAIRPAGPTFQHPDEISVSGVHKQLYRLIYNRTLASQMPNERYVSTTVLVDVEDARFKATGKHQTFAGYRRAWPTTGSDDNDLPELAQGDTVEAKSLEARPHETKPPSRYTEASLVRALEEEGIGRPSTYADIISKIQDRDYVVKDGRSLVPTFKAFFVADFLERYFRELVDTEFTAEMERALDDIAAGRAAWRPYLEEFYHGEHGLNPAIEKLMEEVDPREAREISLEGIPYPVKISRYGTYVEAEVDGETVTVDIPEDTTPDELTKAFVEKLLTRRAAGPQKLGTDPETDLGIYLLTGRYGPYVQLGETDEVEGKPQRASLPKEMEMEDCTLEDARYLLSLPEELGDHPKGGTVITGIGRYGPYVAHVPEGEGKRTYANVKSYQELRETTLEEAIDLIAKKKKRSRKGVIETFEHPETGDKIELRGGRYGPYVKHDGNNKSLPDDLDPDEMTEEDAHFLTQLPVDLGEHPDGGRVFKDIGRYGPYVCHETEEGDRTYANLGSYKELQAIELEPALEKIAAEES